MQLSLFERHTTNYQSNVFTLSRQEFTELEKKIVILLVNQLGNMAVTGKLPTDKNIEFSLPYSELTTKNHAQVTEAAEGLSKKRISYKDEVKGEYIFVTPFPFVKSAMVGGRRYIEIKVLADVVPHFAALGKRFTKYELDIIWSLSSIYAMRMFEIMSMYQHIQKNRFTFLVDELRFILNCPDTYRYNDFQKYVLEVTQRELKQKGNMLLDWQPIKKQGKRVVELEFHIVTVEQLAREGVSQDQQKISNLPIHEVVALAWKVMAQYTLKPWQKDLIASDLTLVETLIRLHSEFENGMRPTVKNRTSYLVKSLGLDKVKPPKAASSSATPTFEPQLSFIPSSSPARSGEVSSIGAVIGKVIPGKKL